MQRNRVIYIYYVIFGSNLDAIIFLNYANCMQKVKGLATSQLLGWFLAVFLLHVYRNGKFWASGENSGENSDINIRSLVPNFFLLSDTAAIWGHFQSIFRQISWKTAILLFPVYLKYLCYNSLTHAIPHRTSLFAVRQQQNKTQKKRNIHRVSKKRPTFTTCYNFYIHSSIATTFWHKCCRESRQSKCALFSHLT